MSSRFTPTQGRGPARSVSPASRRLAALGTAATVALTGAGCSSNRSEDISFGPNGSGNVIVLRVNGENLHAWYPERNERATIYDATTGKPLVSSKETALVQISNRLLFAYHPNAGCSNAMSIRFERDGLGRGHWRGEYFALRHAPLFRDPDPMMVRPNTRAHAIRERCINQWVREANPESQPEAAGFLSLSRGITSDTAKASQ